MFHEKNVLMERTAEENVYKNIFLCRKPEQRAGSTGPDPAGQGEHHPGEEDLKYFHQKYFS